MYIKVILICKYVEEGVIGGVADVGVEELLPKE